MKSKIAVSVCSAIGGIAIGVFVGWLIWGASYGTMFGGPECVDGAAPDANGCCIGETYTDMGDLGFACCPADESLDCFPPIK